MKKKIILLLSLLLVACSGEKKEKVEEIANKEKEVYTESKEQKKTLEIKNISTTSGNNPTIDITLNEEIVENNLESYIQILPKVNYKVLSARDHIIITGNFDINKEYDLKLMKGIKGEKNSLIENIEEKIKFNEVEPKLIFSNEGIILPKINNSKIAFKSVNVKKVNLKIKKIFLNNTTQFLQDFEFKGNGNIFDYYIQNNLYKVGETIFEKDYELNYKKNIWAQNEIVLEKLIEDKGIYIVELSFDKDGIDYNFPKEVQEWQKNSFFANNGKVGRALLVTDMGIVAQKDNKNKSIVSIIDVVENKPLANVKVKSVSVNNQILEEKVTDKNGEVTFEKGDKIFYLLAEKDDEISILKLSDSKLSYDGFLVAGEYKTDDINAFIYSDRGVYRPGDKINLGIIARNDEGSFPEGHPIKIDVFTPRGDKYIDGQILKDGKNGFFTYSFETSKESDTGVWEINVYIGGEKEKRFSLKLPIEAIVPYKIEVDTEFNKDKENNKILGEVSSKYLFGAPGENLKFTSEMIIKEKKVDFERYKKFTFSNPTTYITDIRMNQKGELDKVGKGKVEFTLGDNIPKNINLEGNIVTKVLEDSGRPVIEIDNVDVNTFDTYVGIEKPEDRYIKSGDKLNLQVISVSQDGEKLVKGRKLKYRVYKNEYSWWWDYYDYNNFLKSIKSDKNSILLCEKEFESTDEPYIIDYEVTGSGEVFVEVEDMETHQSSGINLYASTWQDSSTSKKIDKLKIESDKKEYSAGEIAEVKFEGEKGTRALITVEKSGEIVQRYWKDITDNENKIEVKVEKEFFPNAYVTVALFQSYKDSTNDRPLRLYGAVPIIVKDDSKKLNIKLETPESLKPNEKFKVDIKADEKMDYTISVVDEGLLQITDYKVANPYNYFYQKEGLQLSTYDNYSEIIGRTFGDIHQVLTAGGDGYLLAEARMNKIQNSFGFEKSQRFEPLSIYQGVLTTDDEGKGSVEFQLPNYTGAIRVMVTGASGEKYGAKERKIEVKAPIVANVSMPRVLKVGDEFQVPVKVFATEENLGKIELEFEFLNKLYKENIELNSGENKEIFFNIKVENEIGNQEAILRIKSKNYSNEEKIKIDITSNNPYTYINNLEYINGKKSFTYPQDSIRDSVKSRLLISSSPILAIDNRLKELINYPYGCLEQSVSTAFPQLFIDSLTDNKDISKEEAVKNVNIAISKLSSFQLEDGSFAYWPGNSESDLWVTNYVGHFMVMAKEKGFYIPNTLYNSWLNYIKDKVKESDYNLKFKTYALYILALGGEAQIGEMNYIYDNSLKELDNISKWYLASAYALIGENEIARELGDTLSREVEEKSFDYYLDSYGSKVRDEAIILNSYYTIYGEIEKNLYDNIVKLLQSQNWLSTQSIGYSLMSIAQVVEKNSSAEVNGKIVVDGKEIEFNEKDGKWEYINKNMKQVEVLGNNLFVNQYWEGIPINYEQKDESRNIKIERKFYNEKGEEIDVKSLAKGSSFYMELKVLPADDVNGYFYIDNIALTQIIPSGWEIENTRLLGIPSPSWVEEKVKNNNLEYEDIKDDRVNFFFDFNNYNKQGQSFFIKLNSVSKGKYSLPGARAEGMYNNEYRAYKNGFSVEVK